jgi:hypothetical protein
VSSTLRQLDLRAVVAGTLSVEQRALAVRVVSAVALVVTYLLTWDLWQPRDTPPNLPVLPFLGGIGYAIALPLAALLAIRFPQGGSVGHAALLFVAILADQIRLQPECVSLSILLLAAAFPRNGLALGRWHLVALWIWAGLNKALSAGWPTVGVYFMVGTIGLAGLSPVAMVLIPLVETGLGILGLNRRWWPAVRVLGPAVHLQILLTLVVTHWNTSVWPWNIAIALAAPFLFLPDPVVAVPRRTRARHASSTPSIRPRVVTAVGILMIVYPAGFYAGITDAYLAHNLYSANTRTAAICPAPTAGGVPRCSETSFTSTWSTLNVPLPPERRLYIAWFEKVCRPGETLRLRGIWTHLAPRSLEFVACKAEAP